MRKDLRIGLGIGGVLLAVLVVALVVRSHTRQKAQDQKVVAIDRPDATSDNGTTPVDPASGGSTDPVTPPAVSPTSPTPPTPAPADPVKPEKDPFGGADEPKSSWDKILLDGTMPSPAPTVTPSAHGAERTIGEHFGPAASRGATPGTFPPTPMVAVDMPRTPTPPPAVAPPAHASRTHVIAQGETFSTIARTAYGNKKYYLLIEKANPNIVPERLRPGTTIVLPDLPASEHADRHTTHAGAESSTPVDSAREYVVKANDSLYRISMHLYGTPNKVDAIYELNQERIGPDRARLKLGMTLKLPTPPTSAAR